MSALSPAKTLLEGDATLLATATGGVWDYGETGDQGLNPSTTPDAYDDDGRIRPTVLLRSRGPKPDGALRDSDGQYSSTREVLEIYFYEDYGFSNIETMRNRVYALLHEQQLSGTFKVLWSGDSPPIPDPETGASLQRSEYTVHGARSV